MKRRSTFLIIVLGFGFAFFYIPILSMIVYSFNASRLATVWGGFSTKWYVSLLSNQQGDRRAVPVAEDRADFGHGGHDPGHHGGDRLARFTKFRGPGAVFRSGHRAPDHARGDHRDFQR
jgi:putrescine transport system permease protein